MNASLGELSAKQLRQAAALKERIESLESELARLMGAPAETKARGPKARGLASEETSRPRKRRMTAAGRARLAASARKRWAAAKAKGKSRLS